MCCLFRPAPAAALQALLPQPGANAKGVTVEDVQKVRGASCFCRQPAGGITSSPHL